jgi:glycosyltransferase involved in cell wall biosynthesis
MSLKLVIPTIGLCNRGGTRINLKLANILSRRGHRVTILYPRGTNTTTFYIDPKVNLKPVGFRIPQVEDLTSIVKMLMLFPLLEACDLIVANYYLTAFPIAFSSLFRRKRRCVYLIQHYEPLAFGEMEQTFPGLKRWLAETSYRFPMEQIAVSDWIAKRVSKISKRNVHVINPNIDLTAFKPPDGSVPRESNSILAFPGKDVWKGWEDFVQAFAQLQNSSPTLKAIASSRFPFHLPDGPYFGVHPTSDLELAEIYQSATVYVHPSRFEGWGLAPMEAMACGTPVVAAASEGIQEFAVDGENCLLVPVKSPAALADAILRVINDEQLRNRLVAGGYETVKDFAWPKMANEFEELLLSSCS